MYLRQKGDIKFYFTSVNFAFTSTSVIGWNIDALQV